MAQQIEDLLISVEALNTLFSTEENKSVILFADLCDSTLYKQHHPFVNGLHKTLIHNKVITDIVNEYGGRVVKYIGDATMCEFVCSNSGSIVHQAINAAIKIIEHFNVCNKSLPEDLDQIQTKIGIAYGVVAYFYNNDPQGMVVDLAARIEGIAQPNQILIHKDVMDACDLTRVCSSTGKSLNYESKDYFGVPIKLQLKGFSKPQEIVEVRTQQSFRRIKNQYPEYWEDYCFDASLSKIDKQYTDNKFIRDNYYKFVCDVRFETILNRTKFEIVCTNDLDKFKSAMPVRDFFWLYDFPKTMSISNGIEEIFKAEFVKVNDVVLEKSSSTYPYYFMQCFSSGDIENLQGKKVSIQYRITTIISKYAHFYSHTLDFPIRKFSMKLNIGNTDIRRIWAVPYFSSVSIPNIIYTPDKISARGIEVAMRDKELVYPGNGVTLIWRLKSEKPPLRLC